MTAIAESHVEEAALAWLGELGYGLTSRLKIAPDSHAPERAAYDDVLLEKRLRRANFQANPAIPQNAQADALSAILQAESPSLIEENRRLHRFLVECFGIIIAVGLHFIGVPSPILWGIAAFLLRFVPYIGSFIAAGFPVALAAASTRAGA
jgi:AI-2E family transporter/type I restriction and modification enzyme subunit R-like protein